MIRIKNDERVLFVGATGTGKTVLAKYLISGLNRIVVIDPKFTFKAPGFKKRSGLPIFAKEYKIIYRPRRTEDVRLAEFLFDCFKTGNITIYIDELSTLSDMFPVSREVLSDMARTGRERRVSLWSCLQRPRWVPRVMITEAEVMLIFNMRGLEDRRYMAEFTDPDVVEKIPRFHFWYYRPEVERPELMSLNMADNKIFSLGGLKDVG